MPASLDTSKQTAGRPIWITGTLLFLCAAPILAQEGPPLKVRVSPVIVQPIVEQLPLSGTLISPRSTALAARVDGYVEKLLVEAGRRVEAGTALLELDGRIAALELERLTAAREEARVLHRDSERRATEGERLLRDKHISSTEYESLLAQAAARKAGVRQLDAQVAIQQELHNRYTVRAPFAGVIAEKLTEVGQSVRADTPVFRLVQTDPLWAEVNVPERYLYELVAGTPVQLVLDARPSAQYDGSVEIVVPVNDVETRTFLARITVPNPESEMVPGMSARVAFALGGAERAAVLQVHTDAVVRSADGTTKVWVLRQGAQGHIAEPVPVVVGRRSGKRVEVSGQNLGPNDSVVTLGNESLRPGQAVVVDRSLVSVEK